MSLSNPKKVRADTLVRLDIRQLYKFGALRPEKLMKLESQGKVVHSYAEKADSDAIASVVQLFFDPADFYPDTPSCLTEQKVPILLRHFDFGGWSPFWECQGCQTRRWVLYGPLDELFQCSSCHSLSYTSGLISKPKQAERRYAQVRVRLGDSDIGKRDRRVFPPVPWPPGRPKGMSKRDYEAAERVAMRLYEQLCEYRDERVTRLLK